MKIRYKYLLPLALGLASVNAAHAVCDVSLASITGMTAVLKADCGTDTVTAIEWLRDGVSISSEAIAGGTDADIHYTTTLTAGTHKYTATGNAGAIPAGMAATVTVPPMALTVTANAGGSVTSTTPGIEACTSSGGVCFSPFAAGTTVMLNATADTNGGYAFSGWGGDCSGNNGCAVSMTAPRTVTATFSAQPVPGACGAANGVGTASQPSSGLCQTGNAINMNLTGNTYSWNCSGVNGSTTNASCSAPQTVAGNCGTANGQTVASQPSGAAACSPGTVTNMNAAANSYSWTCSGVNGGAASGQCTATMQQVNGACGGDNGQNVASTPSNLCSAGSPTTPTLAGNAYSWNCNGQAGGTNASCSATKIVNGACGSSNGGTFSSAPSSNLCTAGTATQVTLAGSTYGWSCTGANSGSTASCSATYNASSGSCAPAPGNYAVQDYPNYSNSANTIITTIGAGSGLAYRFTIDKAAHPYGYKVSDQVGGTKSYVISRCPGGTDGPVDGQNGSSTVNGDSKLDSCATGGMVMHYKETSGGSASFYSSPYLPYYTSCFLPTTTAQGSATPATYYLNILNTGNATVSIQLKNVPQP